MFGTIIHFPSKPDASATPSELPADATTEEQLEYWQSRYQAEIAQLGQQQQYG